MLAVLTEAGRLEPRSYGHLEPRLGPPQGLGRAS